MPEKKKRNGKLRIQLSTLRSKWIHILSYQFLVLQHCRAKRMGEIELAFRFSCSSYVNTL
jgi:hypothetical protein